MAPRKPRTASLLPTRDEAAAYFDVDRGGPIGALAAYRRRTRAGVAEFYAGLELMMVRPTEAAPRAPALSL